MTSVKRDSVKSYLIEKVVPTIRAKCPQENAYKPKLVHQNNEKTHVDPRDIEFYQAAQKYGFDIRLMCQLAYSPDSNILALGFLV